MQETFITAYTRLDEVQDVKKLGPWMCRIATNKSLNYVKRQRRHWVDIDDVELAKEEEDTDLRQQSVQHIYKCMEDLPDGFRIILTLYLIEGYSHQEIGEQLGIAESTSRSQYTRARKRLIDLIASKHG